MLVLLIERDPLAVVLTLRSASLRAHAGQWSFPGGRIDEGDAEPVAAALREAEEEIGVDPAAVEVLGLLSDVPTSTGYMVTPVVGWLAAPAPFRPSPAEVAEVYEAPLETLTAAIEVVGEVERFGMRRKIYGAMFEGRKIWGATARVLFELRGVLQG